MHNVIPNSHAYIARLEKAARKLGVGILTGAGNTELISEDGRVVAVRVEIGGRSREVRAKGGVILAAGDFSGNAEMRREFLPPDAAAASPINPHASGDGQRLAMALGAATKGMDVTFGPQLRFPEAPKPGLLSRLPTWRWLCKLEAAFVQRVPANWLKPVVRSLLITWMSPSPDMFEQGSILVNRDGNRSATSARGRGRWRSSRTQGVWCSTPASRPTSTLPRTPSRQHRASPLPSSTIIGEAGRISSTRRDAPSLALAIGVDPDNLAAAVADGVSAPLYRWGLCTARSR